ncbi:MULTISPECIES: DNA alkylation repair protein [Arthrobacter]|uniref:DNA alkylation repair protein n=1 Tax=Arthrobacter terricola TaxID=2547396 RepID=A0A4R5KVM3_9MICC|nr:MULTISPECIES: DNA alkylation repair protein [Arthrobacter]MBT8160263.1 DNA alkylation repair protein [Arthrobacter sp. GN70]TDG00032.1 DNA alkylation repair protein [Arthrobacter terricola]
MEGERIAIIRERLRAESDPERAKAAQAYMRSSIPSLGVRVPAVRRMVLATARELPFGSPEELRDDVLTLWREATWREERYAAIDLTSLKSVAGDLEMLPLYEEIIRTGAWWDFVDGVSERICTLLQHHRNILTPLLRSWAVDEDFWIRRAAITAQLKAKAATDRELFAAVLDPNLPDKEFFIRKAIGWSLREYAKTDAQWVRNYVESKRTALSPLSLREALKHLG